MKTTKTYAVGNGLEIEMNQAGIGAVIGLKDRRHPFNEQELTALGFEIVSREDGPWRPKVGFSYFSISELGKVIERHNGNQAITDEHIAIGNCYPTREAAEARIPALQSAYAGEGPDVARLKELVEASWPLINGERGKLIDRNISGSISVEDKIQLGKLQDYADIYLQHFSAMKAAKASVAPTAQISMDALKNAISKMLVIGEIGSALPELERSYGVDLKLASSTTTLIRYENSNGLGRSTAEIARTVYLDGISNRLHALLSGAPTAQGERRCARCGSFGDKRSHCLTCANLTPDPTPTRTFEEQLKGLLDGEKSKIQLIFHDYETDIRNPREATKDLIALLLARASEGR